MIFKNHFFYCKDVIFYVDNHFEKVVGNQEQRWQEIRNHIEECYSCKKYFKCKKAQADIDNYYWHLIKDGEKEFEGIKSATEHIEKDNCKRCRDYLDSVLAVKNGICVS